MQVCIWRDRIVHATTETLNHEAYFLRRKVTFPSCKKGVVSKPKEYLSGGCITLSSTTPGMSQKTCLVIHGRACSSVHSYDNILPQLSEISTSNICGANETVHTVDIQLCAKTVSKPRGSLTYNRRKFVILCLQIFSSYGIVRPWDC